MHYNVIRFNKWSEDLSFIYTGANSEHRKLIVRSCTQMYSTHTDCLVIDLLV